MDILDIRKIGQDVPSLVDREIDDTFNASFHHDFKFVVHAFLPMEIMSS